MRVTLVGIASQYIHQSLAPWCLKAGLSQYGVRARCRIAGLNINQPFTQALEAVMAGRPQAVGFSCYVWNISMVRSLAACVKRLAPDTVIILGGPEAGSHPLEVLREMSAADYVIAGPGEYAFARLIHCLTAGESPLDIPGLAFRCGNGEQVNPPVPLPLPPPSPYTKECRARVAGRIAYVETSRGCPFHCSFCLSGGEESVSFLPLNRAKRELIKAASTGTRTVKLTDRTFNCNRERAQALFRFLIRKRLEGDFQDVCFHFEVAGDLFDKKTLRLLHTAPPGLFQMEIGLQSFHGPALDACRRHTDLGLLKENTAALIGGGNIHVHLDLIAGLPYEDLDTFGKSFDRAFALKPHMLQLGFLKVLPGSPLWGQREEFGLVHMPDPPYEILKTKWLSYRDICRLKRCAQAVDRLYNSGRFRRTLALVLESGLSPFEVFCRFGNEGMRQMGNLSLEELTESAFSFFGGLPGIRREALRDALAWDSLAHDSTGRLPNCLEVPDPRMKKALAGLRGEFPPGARLGACILYDGEERLIWADYSRRDPVTGEYPSDVRPLRPGGAPP